MANPDPSRARRFSLPDLANERADEAISAFLSGPDRRRGRPGRDSGTTSRGNPFAALENRLAWTEALRRENARALRYRRPTAVMVLAGRPTADTPTAHDWLGRVAGPVAHALRRGIRETDLVTRTASASFQVLLPETTEAEAAHVADRVLTDCEVWLHAVGAPVRLRVATAGTTPEVTLDAALAHALRTVDGG
jgi:GGDEF domain-containing protein